MLQQRPSAAANIYIYICLHEVLHHRGVYGIISFGDGRGASGLEAGDDKICPSQGQLFGAMERGKGVCSWSVAMPIPRPHGGIGRKLQREERNSQVWSDLGAPGCSRPPRRLPFLPAQGHLRMTMARASRKGDREIDRKRTVSGRK